MSNYVKPEVSQAEINAAMSDTYRSWWNDDVQKKIDADIEKYRKADGEVKLPASAAGKEIKVEQISHDFIFGAHIFNFDQLGTDERNERYKELYGTLFNSATISFYWKQLELEEGKPRFRSEYRDTAEFWNKCEEPWKQPHWRRPPTDVVVDFCKSKGVRLHGHPLVWGNNTWQFPDWLINKLPFEYLRKADLNRNPANGRLPTAGMSEAFKDMTVEEMEKAIPEFTEQIPGSKLCKSWYGPMPGDYSYRAFKLAEAFFPPEAKLNINDYNTFQEYLDQTVDLLKRGCKIDIMGSQMHMFNPQTCQDIADGKEKYQSPENITETMDRLSKAGLPIHLSEITITAPGGDRKGEIIQAEITRNLYRLWFSIEKMMGITWWNVVDGCGAPGEPSISGLFTRNMEPKLVYFALDELINKEWRTNLECSADSNGTIAFRGFRGNYRLSWTDDNGTIQTQEYHLN
nr:endo-1,4-beta-xylanase [uncultured bacterium]